MKVSILYDDNIAEIELNTTDLVAKLREVIETRFQLPKAQQRLLCSGEELSEDNKTLADAGVNEHDLIIVEQKNTSVQTSSAASATATRPVGRQQSTSRRAHDPFANMSDEDIKQLSFEDIPRGTRPDTLHRIFRINDRLLQSLKHSNPTLYEAASHPEPSKLRMYLMQLEMEHTSAALREQEMHRRLMQNPMDVEAQKQLEEAIQRRNVDSNLAFAQEYMPETFVRVSMLYVNVEVNGSPVKAFVDSGAQSTIISKGCAERCGITRLIDRRYSGVAKGVGTANIVGRVHMAQLKIGGSFFPCTLTVLDQDDVDMLFGLDMLKRHQCAIDLKTNELRLQGANGVECVSFLSENEIPQNTLNRTLSGEGQESAVVPPGAALASSAPPASNTTSAASDEAKIAQLTSMGFDQQSAQHALNACHGDVDMAASILLQR